MFRFSHPVQLGFLVPCGFASLLVCTLLAGTLSAEELTQSPPTADSDFVQPFVTNTTCVVIKLDPTRLGFPDVEGQRESLSSDAHTALMQLVQRLEEGNAQLRVLTQDQPIFATVGIPISERHLPIRFVTKKTSDEGAERLGAWLKETWNLQFDVRDDYLIARPSQPTEIGDERSASPFDRRVVIAKAFEAVGDFPVQVLFLPPDHVRRTLRELLPDLPPQLGGGPSSVLTDGIQWAAWGIDPAELRSRLVVQSASATAAENLASRLPTLIRSAYDASPGIQSQLPADAIDLLIDSLPPRVDDSQVLIAFEGLEPSGAHADLIVGLAQVIETRGLRQRDQAFRQILIAFHNYHDTHGAFPPADTYRDEKGKLHLSWRVHILPFLEQFELYREFRLDEPWDSPHNRPLIAKMPDIYARDPFYLVPRVAIPPGHTTLQVPVGDDTVFGGEKSSTIGQIRDGTSNTVVLVEVKPERAVPWTSPDDYAFDPKDPLDGVLIGGDGRWWAGLADGSTRALRGNISPATALQLFQKADGRPINWDELR